ncbi:MAG: hypothetical protein KUG77_07330 [Nannocystaceae bacterium]|nr:hypothetical protein [Nannocystaceae bacterium]
MRSSAHSATAPEDELDPEDESDPSVSVEEESPLGPGTRQLGDGWSLVHPALEPTQEEQNCAAEQLASPSRFAQ